MTTTSTRRCAAAFRPAVLALALAAAAAALPALADDAAPTTERVQVTDPYLELHTGPGRGYPVHHVAARGEWIRIGLRHTDWYQVGTDNGTQGWVHRRQLVSTLTEAGAQKTFRDIVFDDYLRRRVELGAAWGRFRAEPMLKVWTTYRYAESLSVEGTVGQVQGVYSGTDFWHLNLQVEPWSDQRWSPTFGLGFGRFRNVPNASLVDAVVTDAKLANAGIGVRYHLGERFVVRADYTIYTAFVADTRSTEYRALTAGLAFFF